MKIAKYLLVFVSCIFLTVSCSNDENTEETSVAKEVTNPLASKMGYYHNAIFINGMFKNVSQNDYEMILYTETLHKKHIIAIQLNEAFLIPKEIKQIAYLQHGILINEAVFIGVDGNVSPQLQSDAHNLAKGKIKQSITANSLSHLWISKDNQNYKSLSFTSESLKRQIRELVDVDNKGKCDHGGEGATSCSVGESGGDAGRSVSCGSGYYACCVKGSWIVTQSCHCLKI
ncbi:MAG: hypothetical protein AAF611_11765 [Bacteroidota bacterium]